MISKLMKTKQNIIFWVLLTSIVTFVFVSYFFRIAVYPLPDGDETGLLSIPFRLTYYDDYRYSLIGSESFNAGPIRLYPPLLAVGLRSLFHKLFGFSAELSRYFSSFLVLSTSGLIAATVYRWTRNKYFTLIAFTLVAILPSFIYAGRSIRFEQEIIFLGVFGCLGPLIALDRSVTLRNRMVFVLSGFSLAWAAGSHPYGLGFGLVMFASLLLNRSAWRDLDNLHWLERLFFLALGAVLPVTLTLYPILSDLSAYRTYISDMKTYYAIRNEQLSEFFINNYASFYPLASRILPNWLLVDFLQLDTCSLVFPPKSERSVSSLIQPSFWVGAILACLSIQPLLLVRGQAFDRQRLNRRNPDYLPFTIAALLCIAYLVISAIYPPNTNYYLYPAVSWVILVTFSSTLPCIHNSFNNRMLCWTGRILSILGCFVVLISLIVAVQNLNLLKGFNPRLNAVGLDPIQKELIHLSNEAGLAQTSQPIYADLSSWPAGGKHQASLIDVIALGPDRIPAGMAFEPVYAKLFIESFPTATALQVSPAARRKHFDQAISPLTLAGVLINQVYGSLHLIYSQPAGFDGALRVSLIRNHFDISRWKQSRKMPASLLDSQAKEPQLRWSGVQAGTYLLVLTPKNGRFGENGAYTISADEEPVKEAYVPPQQASGDYGHRVIWLTLPAPTSVLELENAEGIESASLIALTKNLVH